MNYEMRGYVWFGKDDIVMFHVRNWSNCLMTPLIQQFLLLQSSRLMHHGNLLLCDACHL